MKTIKYIISLIIILPLFTIAQQFGQNKVQYRDHEWYFIQTEHFDIYFSNGGETVAEFTAKVAEKALDSLQESFDYKINSRITLITYNSHNDFQSTNVSDAYLSQGVGGFTEPFKNRVVFPFEGDYEKFRHVIHHELVHAVMQDMIYGGSVQNIISKGITLRLPLWYMEGMAEFESSNWETNSDQFIRNAIINEELPEIPRLNGYMAYRGGQAVIKYISDIYGSKKVGGILRKTKALGSLKKGIKASLGLTLEELNERWKKTLKKLYWPEIAERSDPDEFAKRLTDNEEAGGFYNTSPAISPQGDKIAFISDRDIFLDIYVMDAVEGKVIKQVVETGKTNNFEELNVLFPALTWAPDNKRIALSIKSSGYDVIYDINVETEEAKELPFKMGGISSVSWSPNGKYIAFVGSKNEQSDIYLFDFETEEVSNLTNDIFTVSNPSWGPESKKVFFSSDRKGYLKESQTPDDFHIKNHDYKTVDLYMIEKDSKEVHRLTDWQYSDEKSSVVSPDGKEILFVSDKNGIDNIYKKRIELTEDDTVNSLLELDAKPITNSLNRINQLSLSRDGLKLVFTSLYKSGYNIFMINNPFEFNPGLEKLKPTKFMASLRDNQKDISFFNLAEEDTSRFYAEKSEKKTKKDTVNTGGDPKIFTGQYDSPDSTEDAVLVDLSDYVFGPQETKEKSDEEERVPREKVFEEKLDENGNYLVNKYKIRFTPDLVYANAGYSTLYGLLGTTVLSFSDILGNHRLIGITSMQMDLKNSDYGLAYYYLPERIDVGVEGFHTARFVYLRDNNERDLYRFRNYGGVFSASYPLNKFYRFDGSLSLFRVSSENLDDVTMDTDMQNYVIPAVSFVHDNTFFGYTSPIEGTRYDLTLFGNPGVGDPTKSFYSINWDYRKYHRFWYDNLFAWRISGGYSAGANPQRFFMGGTSNWINRSFATGEIPLNDPSDFAFLSPAMPMRGFNYAEQIGSKYSLVNMEFRVPFIRALLAGPVPILFRNILATGFVDVGSAWNDSDKLQLFEKNELGELQTKDLLIGTGVGARTFLFGFLLRFDIGWAYDVNSFSKPKYYLSLGTDF